MASNEGPILLYDGVCVMCNFLVRSIARWDRAERVKFAALESELGQKLRPEGMARDSAVFIDQGSVYTGFAAIARSTRYASGPFLLLRLLALVPSFIGERVYDLVAARRYRWFGKYDSCPLPPPEMRRRMVSDSFSRSDASKR